MMARIGCGVLLGLGGAALVWLAIDVTNWAVFLVGWAAYCAGLLLFALPILGWLEDRGW